MEALAFNPTFEVVYNDFGDFLRNSRKSAFKIDLSRSTVKDVVRSFLVNKQEAINYNN